MTEPATTTAAHALAGTVVPDAAQIDPSLLRYPLAFAIGWGGLALGLGRIERLIGGQK